MLLLPIPAMHMAMVEFGFGGRAHGVDLDGKIEFLTCQFMVGVHGDCFIGDGSHGDRDRSLVGLGLKTHARLDIFHTGESGGRHLLHQIRAMLAIGLFGRYADVELITGRFIEEKVAVLIAGPCGTGKSHIAQAIGHAAVRQGHDVLFTSQSQLLGSLHAARATDAYERKFQTLARVPLLIVDDFGLKPLRPPQDEDFHDLIAERYERTATVITSNLDFGEWGDPFPNQLLGAATLDRLRHGAYRVVLDGKSYRSPRPMENQLEENTKTKK